MKMIAINGSPRKSDNTATLCNSFLKGAASVGEHVETELIHLYDLRFSGCISCFGCKRLSDKTYGTCIVKDELQPALKKTSYADGIVIGSPIYFGDITGQLRCFLERLLFPFSTYEKDYKTIAPKKMPVSMIYTMNVTEEIMKQYRYDERLSHMESIIGRVFSKPQLLYGFNTYQFDDYNKYKMEIFSEQEKAKYRESQFPIECEKAFQAGKDMALSIQE